MSDFLQLAIPAWTAHHNQLLYSFSIFAAREKIRLRIQLYEKIPINGAILQVNNKAVFFDYSDDRIFIDAPHLYDAYFKRSLNPLDLEKHSNVFPLNFQINFAEKPFHLLSQMSAAIYFNKKSRIELTRAIDRFGWLTNQSHSSIAADQAAAHNKAGAKVIFMTRLWDPARNEDEEEKERRRKQNEFRINACRIIKKYFPDSIVGLFPDDFAKNTAEDLLLDIHQTKRKSYLSKLAASAIGIADDGLKDTPGWKIGEYVLFGKAIVSTPITTLVEDFHDGVHYLSTGSRDDYLILPDRIQELLKNDFYREMQQHNRQWYARFLEPHAYVSNILSKL